MQLSDTCIRKRTTMEKRPFPAYRGDEDYVFVSYAHADSARVYPLLTALRERGVNIWYDEGIEPGSKWREELSTAIANADRLLYVASKSSVASQNCERELDYALSLGVPVQVCYLEDAELPPAQSFSLGSHQAIVAAHYSQEEFEQKVYDALTSSPERRLGGVGGRGRRRSILWAAGLIAILAPATIFVATQMRSPDAETTRPSLDIRPSLEAPVRIAIRPLRNATGNEDYSWIGDGLANLLRIELSSSRYAVVMSAVTWNHLEETALTEAALIENAQKNGVDYLISGDLMESGDDLLAALRVTNLRAGIDVMSQTYPELTEEELVASSTKIAMNVKQAMKIPREDELLTLSADFYTENIAAYEAYVNGLRRYNAFEYEEAEKDMRTALALSPDFHIAKYRLANILDTTSRRSQAIELINEIPEDAQLDKREKLYIDAFSNYLRGEFDAAIEQYQEILTLFPYEVEAQQLLASAHFFSYQEQPSIEILKKLKVQEPENPHVLGALGYQLTSIGELDEAGAVLSDYVSLYPELANAWELNGSLKLRRGDVSAAVEDYRAALEIDPAFTAAEIGLARALALSNKLPEAADNFKTLRDDASKSARHRIDAAFDLAYVHRVMEEPGKIESALAPVSDLIREEGARAGLYWYVLSQAQSDLGELDKAEELLANGVRDAPAGGVPTRYLHQRGVLNVMQGEPITQETEEIAQYKLPEDNPDRTEEKAIYHLQGLRALRNGDAEEAVNKLQQAVSLFGYEYGIYKIDLARALFASGKRNDALKLIEDARDQNESLLSGEVRLDLLWHRHRAAHVQADFYTAMSKPRLAESLLEEVH